MSNNNKGRIFQVFSAQTLKQALDILRNCPLWGAELNSGARQNGFINYLVLSSFNEQIVFCLDALGPDLQEQIGRLLHNIWLTTAAPQQFLGALASKALGPLDKVVDYQLPYQLLNCGKNPNKLPEPALPAGLDELGKISRLSYYYLSNFTKYSALLPAAGLTTVFQLETAFLPVIHNISQAGMPFSLDLWETNKQQAVTAAEENKWQTAKQLVDRDLIPHLGQDERLHSQYDPLGAATGRLSSNRPNLQSVPAFTLVRSCFAAPPGKLLISADYSAAELRILAQLSKEPLFLRAFAEGVDFHSYIAQKVFNCHVSKEENSHLRKQAKVINFGLAYGMGAGGLANAAAISLPEAEQLLVKYQETMPTLFTYLAKDAHEAMKRGYAQTILGRRRYLDGLEAAEAERIAKNMPIQGSCADFIKIALIRLYTRLQQYFPAAKIVNTVHDEIIIETPDFQAETIAELTKFEMEAVSNRLMTEVKMVAEVNIATSWQH